LPLCRMRYSSLLGATPKGNQRPVHLLRKDTEETRDPTSPWCCASGSPPLRVASATGVRASGRSGGSPPFRKWSTRSQPTPTPSGRGPFGGRGRRFGTIGGPWSVGSFGCRSSAPEVFVARIMDYPLRKVAHVTTSDIGTSKPWRNRSSIRRSLGIVLDRGLRGGAVSNSQQPRVRRPLGDRRLSSPRPSGRNGPRPTCPPGRDRPGPTVPQRVPGSGRKRLLGCEGSSTDHPPGCDRFGQCPSGRQSDSLDYSSG
jgi:hypothetical protein